MTTLLHKLWHGEIPLARAFWTYAILYGGLLNLLTTAGAFALIGDDAATPWVLVVYFLPVPYNVFIVIAVWRSAAFRGGAALGGACPDCGHRMGAGADGCLVRQPMNYRR